ncbi:hypothetical protein [Haloarcula sp. H-GB5]
MNKLLHLLFETKVLDIEPSKERFTAVTVFISSIILKYTILLFFTPLDRALPIKAGYSKLIGARNIHQVGYYSVESGLNIVLSTDLARTLGEPSAISNSLIPVLYGFLFEVVGFIPSLPLHISIILSSVTAVVYFHIANKMFNYRIGLLFTSFYLSSSIILYESLWGGFYEFAFFFFSLVLYFLFARGDSDTRYSVQNAIIVGFLTGLTILSRNAFAFSLSAVFVYTYFKKPESGVIRPKMLKYMSVVTMSAIAATSILWITIVYLGHSVDNSYVTVFTGIKFNSFENFKKYGHLFPDPYTYHFRRTSYLSKVARTTNEPTTKITFLQQYGVEVSPELQRGLYLKLAKDYVFNFFSVNGTNSPSLVTVGFLLVGLKTLWKKRPRLLVLFITWPVMLLAIYVFLGTSNWDHYLEVVFPVFLLQSIGVYKLFEVIRDRLHSVPSHTTVATVFIIALLLVPAQAAVADAKPVPRAAGKTNDILAESQVINNANVSGKDIIAYGGRPSQSYDINYFTDVNIVPFRPETISHLRQEDKLVSAFNKYNVTIVYGYERQLSCSIKNETSVRVIGADCNQASPQNVQVSVLPGD